MATITKLTPAQADFLRRLDGSPHAYSTWQIMSRLAEAGLTEAMTDDGLTDQERAYRAYHVTKGRRLTEKGRDALAAYDGPKRIGRPAKGERAMTPAEKQAAYRARHQADQPVTLTEARHLLQQLHFFTRIAVNAGSLPDQVAGNTPRETANLLATWIAKQGFVSDEDDTQYMDRVCAL